MESTEVQASPLHLLRGQIGLPWDVQHKSVTCACCVGGTVVLVKAPQTNGAMRRRPLEKDPPPPRAHGTDTFSGFEQNGQQLRFGGGGHVPWGKKRMGTWSPPKEGRGEGVRKRSGSPLGADQP